MSVVKVSALIWVVAVTWGCVQAVTPLQTLRGAGLKPSPPRTPPDSATVDGRVDAAAANRVILQLADPYVYEGGKRCGVDTKCLTATSTEAFSGEDALGKFSGSRTHYNTTAGTMVTFSARDYGTGTQVFRQDFPDGLKGTSMGNKDGVSTCFPCFALPGPSEAPDLRYATPGGNMAGWTGYTQGSVATDLDSFNDGEDGGVVILFSGEVGNVSSVVISPLTYPMATNVMLNRTSLTLEWGVQGQAELIPAGYAAEVILKNGSEGIGRNVMAWGAALQSYHATAKVDDQSAQVLAYWTDNGAAHYYNPLPYDNYHDAMMSVYNYSVANDLPIKRLQLDSWFYFKGAGDGVKNYTADESLLPGGINGLHNETGWPTMTHNRWFSSDNVYARQNGGKYLFTIDEDNQFALPLEKVFWDDLFATTVPWGLVTYEQDWLDQQYKFTSALHTNLTLGSKWLSDMGAAAHERNLTIMYCMSFVRHVLHSVSLPAVTMARVSADYLADLSQWKIGVSSLLAHALAIRPFKDVFWTSKYNDNEAYADCQTVLSDSEHPRQATHSYSGRINVSASGKPCVPWRDFGWDKLYFGSGIYENFCRNPENMRDGAFCYTLASFDLPEEEWQWEYCAVPRCQLDCYTENGVLFVGLQNITQSGLTCVDWNGEFGLDGAVCRNPDNDVAPWCYTNAKHTERDYCDGKCRATREESNPHLQSAVSTLSAGPIGVGDLAENLNISLIQKSISADGRLLQASKPLTVIDAYFFDSRQVWTAYSNISSIYFGIIFLAETEGAPDATGWDLNLENAFVNETLVFSLYPEDLGFSTIVSQDEALDLPPVGGSRNFCLLYTTPLIPTEGGDLFILGELEKWVPVSPNRIQDIVIVPSSSQPSLASTVLLSVRGVKDESVSLSFGGADDYIIQCDFVQDGLMTADTQARTCET